MFDETIVEKWRKENLAMNEGVEPEKIVTEKVSRRLKKRAPAEVPSSTTARVEALFDVVGAC